MVSVQNADTLKAFYNQAFVLSLPDMHYPFWSQLLPYSQSLKTSDPHRKECTAKETRCHGNDLNKQDAGLTARWQEKRLLKKSTGRIYALDVKTRL